MFTPAKSRCGNRARGLTSPHMTDAELPPSLTRLTFHGPLSEARAARFVARLTRNSPRTVLAAHPGHPRAAEIRERVDQHRSFWLRGYYGLLGLAYLTLVPVA